MTRSLTVRIALGVAMSAAMAVGIYALAGGESTFRAEAPDVLHSTGVLTATGKRLDRRNMEAALLRAQRVLVDIATQIGGPGAASDTEKLGQAVKGRLVKLSWQGLEVLRLGRELTRRTGGAYDMSAGGWKNITIKGTGVEFTASPFRLDLTETARCYAVDKALHAMSAPGVRGARVDLGGVTRCFGVDAEGEAWRVSLPDPFVKDGSLGTLGLGRGAACSASSDGRAATVVAPSAIVAGAWARALVVLGAEGLARIDADVEAVVVVGGKDNWTWSATPGFEKLLSTPLPPQRRLAPPPTGRPATTSRPATEPRP